MGIYKKTPGRKVLRAVLVLAAVGGVAALVVFRTQIKRYALYIDARVSQEGAAASQGALVQLNAPNIIIRKGQRRLFLCDGNLVVRMFPIGLGFSPEGPKTREGDGKTPEGDYYICSMNPNSKFHMSLGLSYPNAADADAALASGLITEADRDRIFSAMTLGSAPPWDTPLGGEIFIHGHGSKNDWTAGCIALDDSAMDQLYGAVTLRTPVEILP